MIMELLLSSIAATAITFRKELSGQSDIPAPTLSFEIEGKPSTTQTVALTERQQELVFKSVEAMKSSDFESALSFANRLLKLDADSPVSNALVGECYKQLGKVTEALESYDKALHFDERVVSLSDELINAIETEIQTLEDVQTKLKESGSPFSEKEVMKVIESVENEREAQAIRKKGKRTKTILRQTGISDRRVDPIQQLQQLRGRIASNRQDRLLVYEKVLDALLKLGVHSSATFHLPVNNITVKFYCYSQGKPVRNDICGEVRGFPKAVKDIARNKGFKVLDGGLFEGLFGKPFPNPIPKRLAETTERLLAQATGNKSYSLVVSNVITIPPV